MQESPIDIAAWISEVRSLWLKRNIKLASGASRADIEFTELEVGFQFPADMKELYLAVDGFRDWDMDPPSMISIWPMERIREQYNTNPDKNFVGFCDYLINSHHIGFLKDSAGIYKCYDEFNPIAKSFQEVIGLINADAHIIF
jgi:hypothetical protein